jgi:eukaryotic-like serine/threonine-protein kinase
MSQASGALVGGRYRIQDELGQGGMQEVYAAHDTMMDKVIALKVPKTPSAKRRFKRSAVLSARVNHANVAKTLDYVEVTGSERAYLIEEYVEGQDLSKLRAVLPLMDPYLVAHFLHHLARGVAASHHVEVVHRDLKPSNIMVSPDFRFDAIKITDFGIAKMAEEEIAEAVEGGDQTLTNSSTAIGALPYMAPEMMTSARTSGKPADVWALGAICYELLTGSKPFGSGFQVVTNVRDGNMTPPDASLDKAQFRGLVAELMALLKRCMNRDAAGRPTADQLVAECTSLCYPESGRRTGTLVDVPYGTWGRVTSGEGDVFFHPDSLYGTPLSVGDRVCFSAFAGSPYPRAHPIVRVRSKS